ncbi:MAG: aspartate kinase [Ignavibacteria bacterium]|nr:aspartate kinase [Ignavibacteria bacterium]
MIVMKFGGTSVQDAEAMHNVASIVKNHLERNPFIVISAIATGTNLLDAIGKSASKGNKEESLQHLAAFIGKHIRIAEEGITNPNRLDAIFSKIFLVRKELERLAEGIFLLRELSPRSSDALAQYGEFLSSLCVSEIFTESGISNEWLDARTFMITDDNFTAASPRTEIVEQKLRELYSRKNNDTIFVTQGFIGATESRISTTMGRESSDFTASIIGAALNAEEIQIWTDVDGIYTADPRIVSTSRRIPQLSYTEALELCDRGAKVLHPKTMVPAMNKNIPVRIRNSKNVIVEGSIVSMYESTYNEPVALSMMKHISLVFLTPTKKLRYVVISEMLNEILTKNKTIPLVHNSTERSVAFVFDNNAPLDSLLEDFSDVGIVKCLKEKSLISLVGNRIGEHTSTFMKFLQVLLSRRMYYCISNPSGLSIASVVDDEIAETSFRELHKIFFE